VRRRLLFVVVADEILHPEFWRREAYGQRVDRLASGFEIRDAREDDLGARKPV
jgi:hypothetical protein